MSMSNLLAERGQCVDRMRSILNTAEKEGRDLNEGERAEYEAKEARQAEIANLVNRKKSLDGLAAEIDRPMDAVPGLRPSKDGKADFRNAAEYKEGFNAYLRRGKAVLDSQFLNALQVGTDSEGGYIVPEEFDTALVQALLDHNEIRQYATVIRTGSDRNIPVESDEGTATWTAEEAAYTEDDPAFSQVVLGAHKLTKIAKVSEELLQDAFFDVQGYLVRNFARNFGSAEETAFVNGNGTGKPTGIVTGASAGVTAASATAITADELIDLFHALGRPYRKNAHWIINDATAKLIRKLKDGDSQYLWQPGLQAGQPDMLLGRPVLVSSAMPTAAASAKAVVFGDLSYYTIADRANTAVQRLNELYAANGQIGFRAFKRTEGKVTLSSAIKLMTMAAA